MLWLYLYPRSCPVAERLTFTNSRRTRRFPEGPFSHDSYFRLLWDDLSIHFFLKKGKGRKEKWEAEKRSRWIHLPAAHTTLAIFSIPPSLAFSVGQAWGMDIAQGYTR